MRVEIPNHVNGLGDLVPLFATPFEMVHALPSDYLDQCQAFAVEAADNSLTALTIATERPESFNPDTAVDVLTDIRVLVGVMKYSRDALNRLTWRNYQPKEGKA